MIAKLAVLFLVCMAALALLSARPRQGDGGWRSRFRWSRLRRRRPPGKDAGDRKPPGK